MFVCLACWRRLVFYYLFYLDYLTYIHLFICFWRKARGKSSLIFREHYLSYVEVEKRLFLTPGISGGTVLAPGWHCVFGCGSALLALPLSARAREGISTSHRRFDIYFISVCYDVSAVFYLFIYFWFFMYLFLGNAFFYHFLLILHCVAVSFVSKRFFFFFSSCYCTVLLWIPLARQKFDNRNRAWSETYWHSPGTDEA